jgi:xanthine dehydrogenase accessory factor
MSVRMSTPALDSPPASAERPPPADAAAPGADEWLAASLDDDMTPVIKGLAEGTPFALATLFARDGGPRPVGAQMVVTTDRRWGFLSGGCIEADVASHARAALLDGQPRQLAYGRGSPFFDIRLPCGGRIDVLVEPLRRDDLSILRLLDLTNRRRPARYLSDGRRRLCLEPEASADGDWVVDRTALPAQRLAVVGSDPFAIAIAVAGSRAGKSA